MAKSLSELGLKARNMTARGNAPGNLQIKNQALKGRHIFINKSSPWRNVVPSCAAERGADGASAPFLPIRTLPKFRAHAFKCSAELHSAVSQIFNLPVVI